MRGTMRIATWNLERGGRTRAARTAQDMILRSVEADVVVLTEPSASFAAGIGVVVSPPRRTGRHGTESWVAIVGPSVEPLNLPIPFERISVAARAVIGPRTIVIYGSVLPWLSVRSHAPDLVRDGEDYTATFARVLEAQKADLLRLKDEGDVLVWAGDFNQSLVGPNRGGSTQGRTVLHRCLEDLGLVAWNAEAKHALPNLCAIDLICGPRVLTIAQQGRIEPVHNGVKMSDHAGYWVDL